MNFAFKTMKCVLKMMIWLVLSDGDWDDALLWGGRHARAGVPPITSCPRCPRRSRAALVRRLLNNDDLRWCSFHWKHDELNANNGLSTESDEFYAQLWCFGFVVSGRFVRWPLRMASCSSASVRFAAKTDEFHAICCYTRRNRCWKWWIICWKWWILCWKWWNCGWSGTGKSVDSAPLEARTVERQVMMFSH